MGVIQAYIDESGTHTDTDAPAVCVACYFASSIKWAAFEKDWKPVLEHHGIKCFQAKNREHDIIRPFLADIIEGCKLRGVVTAVNRKTYDAYASAQTKSLLGDAYGACMSNCVIKVCRLGKELYPGSSVKFFIAAGQPKNEHIVLKLNSMTGNSFDSHCAPIAGATLADKEDITPLQTADFLSHVYSTQDTAWINRLTSRGLIWFSPVGSKGLEETAL